jgi:hypothetical protein
MGGKHDDGINGYDVGAEEIITSTDSDDSGSEDSEDDD